MRRSAATFVFATAAASLAFLGEAAAQGCGPTRLKVTESVTLDLAPEKVWALVGNFQDVSWDPLTIAVKGTGGNAPEEAKRTVTLKGGAVLGESLYKYDATAMNYAYHIDQIDVDRLPVQNVSATLEVVPEDGGTKSIIRWKSAFYRYLRPDEGAPDAADQRARDAMQSFLRDGLAGLKTKTNAKT